MPHGAHLQACGAQGGDFGLLFGGGDVRRRWCWHRRHAPGQAGRWWRVDSKINSCMRLSSKPFFSRFWMVFVSQARRCGPMRAKPQAVVACTSGRQTTGNRCCAPSWQAACSALWSCRRRSLRNQNSTVLMAGLRHCQPWVALALAAAGFEQHHPSHTLAHFLRQVKAAAALAGLFGQVGLAVHGGRPVSWGVIYAVRAASVVYALGQMALSPGARRLLRCRCAASRRTGPARLLAATSHPHSAAVRCRHTASGGRWPARWPDRGRPAGQTPAAGRR